MVRTTYLYDDPDHPDRMTGSTQTAEWTEDDRALMLGLLAYEATLCPGCGQPRHLAWHRDSEDEYEGNHFVCHGCTAQKGEETTYSRLEYVKPPERIARMPDFNMDLVTKATEKPKTPTE